MAGCRLECEGIRCDQGAGLPPRGLFWDDGIDPDGESCVVIGINPGPARPDESSFYRDAAGPGGNLYASEYQYWSEVLRDRRDYYRRLRVLVSGLGFTGPILWTNLAKCENATGVKYGQVPLQTFRTCSTRYLASELSHIPEDWPVVAVGSGLFPKVALMYPQRQVIGVPHATGQGGHTFRQLLEEDEASLRAEVRGVWNHFRGANPQGSLYLRGTPPQASNQR